MDNLGKANVEVILSDGLPGINKEPTKYNMDVSAFNWGAMKKSPFFYPLLTEQILDKDGQFAALLPERRQFYVDNFLSGSSLSSTATSSSLPYINFLPIDITSASVDPLPYNLVNSTEQNFDTYTLLQPADYETADLTTYKGPLWREALVGKILPPDDIATIKTWWTTVLGLSGSPPSFGFVDTDPKTLYHLNQTVVRDGLYWGIKSSDFLRENMPFWVNLKIARTPPVNKNRTWFVISLGSSDETQAFDIYFGLNEKTSVYDYHNGRAGASSAPAWRVDFDTDLATVLDDQDSVRIGIMTVAGRLVVWINNVPLVYTRTNRNIDAGDDSGTILECKIADGNVKIFGSNVQARINVCPMTFAPLSAIALALPTIIEDGGSEIVLDYQAVDNKGNLGGPVCVLPTDPETADQLYGVDCDNFVGDAGTANPEGFGHHEQGLIGFRRASSAGITTVPSADYYFLYMVPEDVTVGTVNLVNGGCPYFFRIKGQALRELAEVTGGTDVTDDVMSATESTTAPDYFHALSTASVTLYNKGGIYDFLRDGQKGITIKWGWGSDLKQTFTGIVTSTTTNETPGMETLTLQCEDYMHVLKNTPIVNSPFYDGMVAYYALKDLAERGGVDSFIKDWVDEEDYFLKSGYSFSKPLIRYPAKQMIFECMIDMIKNFEAFMYFDPDGKLHLDKLPGGLFGSGAAGSVTTAFVRNQDVADESRIILDEKAIEYNFASTVNRINIWSLNRDTRASVLYTKSAVGAEDNVLYRRLLLIDQPAYGDIEVARTYAERLGDRVFYPIRKTGFKTIGLNTSTIQTVFDFISVDGDEFRVMGIQRSYNAEENTFTNEYNVEWLNGA